MRKFAWLFAVLMAWAGFALAAVNVNTATKEQLESLNGIGPVKAQAIIDYRAKNGPFKKLEDLKNVDGIGDATFDKIRGDVSLSGRTSEPKADAAKPAEKKAEPAAKPAAKHAEEKKADKKADEKKAAADKKAEDKKAAAEKKAAPADDKKAAADKKAADKKAAAEKKAEEKKAAADKKAEEKKAAADKKKADAAKQDKSKGKEEEKKK